MKRIHVLVLVAMLLVAIFTSCDMAVDQGDLGDTSHNHSFGEWNTVKKPTCSEEGIEKRVCSCGESEEQAIPAIGHIYSGAYDDVCNRCGENRISEGCTHSVLVDTSSLEPTCTKDGYTAGKACKDCNKVIVTGTVIPATGHNMVNRVCTVCGTGEYSKGLSFTSNRDGTCYVSGIGSCNDTVVVIPQKSPSGDKVTNVRNLQSWNYKTVVLPETIEWITTSAFYMTSVENFIVAEGNSYFKSVDGVIYSKDGKTLVCYPCEKKADNYVVPDGVTKIDQFACSSAAIKTITLPSSLKTIEYNAFSESDLESVEIPNGVTEIKDAAFAYCSSLYLSIVIPGSVKSIGENAFTGCFAEEIILGEGIESIGKNAFCSNDFSEIVIPATVTKLGYGALSDCEYAVIKVAEGNKALKVVDGCLLSADGTVFYQYGMTKNNEYYTVPNGVKIIGDSAFSNVTSLRGVELPQSLERINDYAFSYSYIYGNVEIPDSVNYIGKRAFFDTYVTSVILPESLTCIEELTFARSNIEAVYIPLGVTSIADGAFSETRLTDLLYRGTAEQWAKVVVGNDNDKLISAEKTYKYNPDEY